MTTIPIRWQQTDDDTNPEGSISAVLFGARLEKEFLRAALSTSPTTTPEECPR